MFALSTSNYVVGLIFSIAFIASTYFSARTVHRALTKGSVRFFGNHPRSSANTYQRSETPGLFWFGIALYVFLTALSALIAICGIVYLITERLPLPGFHADVHGLGFVLSEARLVALAT
jgi:hypothetical protein